MHDPMTVAFDIKAPWWRTLNKGKPGEWRYHSTLLTIWHVDPETDGSDDSCGWTFPKNGERERAFAKELADWEEQFPYYFAMPVIRELTSYEDFAEPGSNIAYHRTRISAGDCIALCADLFATFRWRLYPERRKWGLTPRLMAAAYELGAANGDNLQGAFAFDDQERSEEWRKREAIERAFLLAIGYYRRVTRRWWQHPKWHVHHWRIQVPVLNALKRWLFSRCAECGRRFPWGYAPIAGWNSDGPRWFRGESNVRHHDCRSPDTKLAAGMSATGAP